MLCFRRKASLRIHSFISTRRKLLKLQQPMQMALNHLLFSMQQPSHHNLPGQAHLMPQVLISLKGTIAFLSSMMLGALECQPGFCHRLNQAPPAKSIHCSHRQLHPSMLISQLKNKYTARKLQAFMSDPKSITHCTLRRLFLITRAYSKRSPGQKQVVDLPSASQHQYQQQQQRSP